MRAQLLRKARPILLDAGPSSDLSNRDWPLTWELSGVNEDAQSRRRLTKQAAS